MPAPSSNTIIPHLWKGKKYLWGVLVKQAYISAIIDICYYVFLLVICALLVWFWQPLFKGIVAAADKTDGIAIIAVVLLGILFAIVLLVAFFSVGGTVTALINPEYWALKEILQALKIK